MAKKVNEIVQRINSWYVGEDCAQLMVPYKNGITILNKDGILYHHNEGSNVFINKYVEDERRKQFPYYNIPEHYTKFFWDGKYHYTNQLFEFEQPYIKLSDGHLIESYVVKDRNEALIVNKVMTIIKNTSFKTKEELEQLFAQPENVNERLYYLYFNGKLIRDNEFFTFSESDIFEYVKNQLLKNVEDFRDYVSKSPETTVGSYLRKNYFFLDFVEHSIDSFDLKGYKLNIHLNNESPILLVKTNGIDITIQAVDIYFITYNYYKVDIYDIPVTKYSLEQLELLTPKIARTKEPKIPLKLNPSVSKEEIKEAKQLILQRKKVLNLTK